MIFDNIIDKWWRQKEQSQNLEVENFQIQTQPQPDYKPRPIITFEDFVGAGDRIDFLKLQVEAAILQDRPLAHLLLTGPPGLGKSTLAEILAVELNALWLKFMAKELATPRKFDMLRSYVADIKSPNNQKVLFIDEIHSIRRQEAETLYDALSEEPMLMGKAIEPFTLIAATTYSSKIDKPLKDRMINFTLEYYSAEELRKLIRTKFDLPDDVCSFVAERARGIPRLAIKYAKQVINAYTVDNKYNTNVVEPSMRHAEPVMDYFKVREKGFTDHDINVLKLLAQNTSAQSNRYLAKNNITGTLLLDTDDYDTLIEPFLLRHGMIFIGPRGRCITEKGLKYVQDSKSNEG